MTNEKECYVCEQTAGQSSRRVMLFAEAEGFAHLHFHIVPRQPDLPADRRGPAIFGYLEEEPMTEEQRDGVALRIREAWTAMKPVRPPSQ